MILKYLGEYGGVSRRAFDLLPYSYKTQNTSIKALLDSKFIGVIGRGNNKFYYLRKLGKEYLTSLNPTQYKMDNYMSTKSVYAKIDRIASVGDCLLAVSLAGYFTHTNDCVATQNTLPNGYYSAVTIKDYLCSLFGDIEESVINAIRYSRIAGVLLTVNRFYRVYHTGENAMSLRETGEKNISIRLHETFHTTHENGGAIVFGNVNCEAFFKILSNSMMPTTFSETRFKSGVHLNVTNLAKPLIFLPMQKEMLTLLELLNFPEWKNQTFAWILEDIFTSVPAFDTAHSITATVSGESVFIGIDLDMLRLYLFLTAVNISSDKHGTIICLDWQKSIFERVIQTYLHFPKQWTIKTLPNSFLEETLYSFHSHWRNQT